MAKSAGKSAEWEAMAQRYHKVRSQPIDTTPQDPERIARMVGKLTKAWLRMPDARFGQFLLYLTGGQWVNGAVIQSMDDRDFERLVDRFLASHLPDAKEDASSLPYQPMPGS